MADITGSIGGKHCFSWSTSPWPAPPRTGVALGEAMYRLDAGAVSNPATAVVLRRHAPSGRIPVRWNRPTAAWESLAICGDQLFRPEDDAPRTEATPMQRWSAMAEWVAANLEPWTIRDDVDARPG